MELAKDVLKEFAQDKTQVFKLPNIIKVVSEYFNLMNKLSNKKEIIDVNLSNEFENLLSEDGKVSLGNKKILLLIIQSLTYYILLFFLYKKILDYLPSLNAKITILFLAFEPTIFMYHSSFWSESIFFSLQLLVILFIFNKNHNININNQKISIKSHHYLVFCYCPRSGKKKNHL